MPLAERCCGFNPPFEARTLLPRYGPRLARRRPSLLRFETRLGKRLSEKSRFVQLNGPSLVLELLFAHDNDDQEGESIHGCIFIRASESR